MHRCWKDSMASSMAPLSPEDIMDSVSSFPLCPMVQGSPKFLRTTTFPMARLSRMPMRHYTAPFHREVEITRGTFSRSALTGHPTHPYIILAAPMENNPPDL